MVETNQKLDLLIDILAIIGNEWFCVSLTKKSIRMRHPTMGEKDFWFDKNGYKHMIEIPGDKMLYDSKAIREKDWTEEYKNKMITEGWEFLKLDHGVVYIRKEWKNDTKTEL